MEFDVVWILLGLPVAFGLGWLASRFDLRQLRIENRRVPRAYFKGLNYLLNEQQDQAIDAFIEAVQSDPDTSDLHFALGNLFRRRGEYDRAVRVHQHLLSRGDLGRADRQRAQYELALDFLKAGLLDHAESALQTLEDTPFEQQARLARMAIYERSHEWPQAAEIVRLMHDSAQGDFSVRLAHYLCELAQEKQAADDAEAAQTLLEQAIETAPQAPRAWMELARLQLKTGHAQQACTRLARLCQTVPQAVPLAAELLVSAASACGRQEQALQLLRDSYSREPSLAVLDGIAALEPQHRRQWYMRHLEHEPSLIAAGKWLADENFAAAPQQQLVMHAIQHAAQPLARFRCAACGFEAKQRFWQCPGCQAWDSYPAQCVEEL